MKVPKRHRIAAESSKYLRERFTGDAEDMVGWYLAAFKRLGYRTVFKKAGKGRLRRFTQTMRRCLYLGSNWKYKSTRDQAALLAHEYVHALQWRAYRAWGARYFASAWFRWTQECQGYRETVRARRYLGVSEAELERYAWSRTWRGYAFSKRFRKAVKGATARALLKP